MTGGAPRVSVVVLSWNTRELLAACLTSLRKEAADVPLEVIVVDNASADGSADLVAQQYAEVVLLRNARNEGYAIGNNQGVARARADYVLLLNSDTEVRPGAIGTLARFLDTHPGHGACAPRLERPDGTPQPSCKTFPTLLTAVFYDTVFDRWFPHNATLPRYEMRDFDHLSSRDVDQPPAAALLVRRALWEQLGGFDPELWLFYNDVDFCRRLREAGHAIAYVAEARVLHHEGKSTAQFPEFGAIWHRNRLSYYRKTFGWRGTAVARVMTLVRGVEEVRKLRRAGAPPEARAAVWRAVRAVWTA
ncbi:MAG TPA: glycosyltransferase family 2 protein [Planctomycetota bacterium]|nr:glycosyltransferase family 2 protein [Planctomycetota bacterium]